MTIDMNQFAVEVHENAVTHGFYDPAPSDEALIAAIHAEISEAFEEWRDGKPNVWYECDGCICNSHMDEWCAGIDDETGELCSQRDPEPHGIAVELIDVALRVLDLIAGHGLEVIENDVDAFIPYGRVAGADKLSLPRLVLSLHYGATAIGIYMLHGTGDINESLNAILAAVFAWLRAQNLDPEALLLEKHEYNKTRPYRHGGKRI